MLQNKESKFFKIFLICNLFLLLTGTAIIANRLFFREIEIKIEGIEWVEEFKIEIPEIKLNNPSILVIGPDKATIKEDKLEIHKQGTQIGKNLNSQILIPLRIESKKEDKSLFFIPQFRAKIIGGEKIGEEDLRLKANFSLYLLTNNCPEDREKIQGQNFILCDIEISSSNVMSFSITERRKNILVNEIKNLTNKQYYILALKIAPDLKKIKNLSSFSIIVENITPELIVPE